MGLVMPILGMFPVARNPLDETLFPQLETLTVTRKEHQMQNFATDPAAGRSASVDWISSIASLETQKGQRSSCCDGNLTSEPRRAVHEKPHYRPDPWPHQPTRQ